MSGVEMSIVLWGITLAGTVSFTYWRGRSETRHLDDTKADRKEINGKLEDMEKCLMEKLDKADQKTDSLLEIARANKLIIQRLPCEQRGFKPTDCEGGQK